MLKIRIIPCLDIKDGRVVKGVKFADIKDAGDPVYQAKIYDEQGADELVFYDINASHENRSTTYDLVQKVAGECFMPLTVGGGVKTLEDIRNLLLAGADKVSINTGAISNPDLVREGAEKFGSQCIVVAIDAKRKGDSLELYTHGGRKPTGIDGIQWVKRMEKYGAGEIVFNSIDSDGTKEGFDNEFTRKISRTLGIPVVASGGVGNLQHFIDGVKLGGASAVLAASVFHFGTYSIPDVKNTMKAEGIEVRL